MKLVQRCEFETSDINDVSGVDSLFRYEYMGAAEYEFGSLCQSLRRIVPIRASYIVADSGLRFQDGAALMVFCETSKQVDVLRDIADIASRKAMVKEGARLKEVLAGEDPSFYRTEAWWDINDDWIAFRGEERGPLVVAAIEAVQKKWAAKSVADGGRDGRTCAG